MEEISMSDFPNCEVRVVPYKDANGDTRYGRLSQKGNWYIYIDYKFIYDEYGEEEGNVIRDTTSIDIEKAKTGDRRSYFYNRGKYILTQLASIGKLDLDDIRYDYSKLNGIKCHVRLETNDKGKRFVTEIVPIGEKIKVIRGTGTGGDLDDICVWEEEW
jgi:hypothetical protein